MRAVGLLILLLGCMACTSANALTMTGNVTPSPATVEYPSCPSLPGYACATTASTVTHLPNGRNTGFETAWNNVLIGEWDPTGWTLNWAAEPVDAVFNIETNRAYADESDWTSGVQISIAWSATAEQTDLKWIQALHTNRPRQPYEWYMDIWTLKEDRPPLYPFQYEDQRFGDKPWRFYEAGEHIFWDAYLYLARVDRTNKIATIYEGFNYGFTLDSWAVPEPSSLVALIVGPVLLALRRFRLTFNR